MEINVYMHLLRRTVPLFKGIRALWRNVESLTKEKKTGNRGKSFKIQGDREDEEKTVKYL